MRPVPGPSGLTRREVLAGGLLLAAMPLFARPSLAADTAPDSANARPAGIPEGRAGDFSFLDGEWRIAHRWRASAGANDWLEFAGEATCWSILGGIGSVEELRIPARNFSGMGLRLLDVERKLWSDLWVNAKSGVLTTPGTFGGFRDGVGAFVSEDREGERPMLARGMWDRITGRSHRWLQSVSYDNGRSWADTWVMEWRKA